MKKKMIAFTLATVVGTNYALHGMTHLILANDQTRNYENKEHMKTLADAPDVSVETNITLDKVFNVNENLTMTFDIKTEADTKTIKQGDKIVIQLPPGGINSYVLDSTEVIQNKTNITFNKERGEFVIEFIEDIAFTGSSQFRINFVVSQKKVTNYPIQINYERGPASKEIPLANNRFSSKGEESFTYMLLSPYWNTSADNYVGQTPDNKGQFLTTKNTASFYIDVNYGFNIQLGNSFAISLELENQRLLQDSIRVYRYESYEDVVGVDVTDQMSFQENASDGIIRVHTPDATINKRYRVYYDVEVENISAPIISQFYGQSAGVPDDKYYPIIHTIMTNKKSDSDYIPVIYGPTYETIKVGEPFDERRGMSAFDEEDGNLTTQITILENTVQPDVPGTYKVVYQVIDKKGNIVQLTKVVKVTTDNPPTIHGVRDHKIYVGTPFDPRNGVTAEDVEDLDLTDEIKVIENVDEQTPGTYQVMYEVTDTDGNKVVATCIVVVVTNTIPTIQANNITILEGTEINLLTNAEINVQANDAEDGPITNLVTIKDKDGFNEKDPKPGTYHVVFTVTDTDHNTVEKTITVTVNPRQITINKAPMIHAENKVITVGDIFNPLEGVTARDPEEGTIKVTMDHVIKNEVNEHVVGVYEVTYKVSDSKGAASKKTITVTVNPRQITINKAPMIHAENKIITVGDTFNPLEGVTARDPEEGTIKVTMDHVIKNEVNEHVVGVYEVTYKVSDSKGAASKKTITVTVNPRQITINKAPMIHAENKIITVGDTFNPLEGVTARDPEEGTIKVTMDHVIKNEVNEHVVGVYEVTYKVSDSKGAASKKTITVTVNPRQIAINKAPMIHAENKIITVGDTFDPLEGVSAHDHEDGEIVVTLDYVLVNDVDTTKPGTYTVKYKVSDSMGASKVKSIVVVVNPKMEALNHIPTINVSDKVLTVGDTFNPLEGVSAHDHEDGEIVVTLDHVLVNDVDTTKPGTYTVTYKVSDSMGASSLKTITVIVNEKVIQQIEQPNKAPTTGDMTNTGDATNMGLMSALLVGSSGLLFGLKRKKQSVK